MKQVNLKEYLVPGTLEQAIAMLCEYKGSVKVIAGGTDLLVDEQTGLDAMVDISKTGLGYIKIEGETLCIGSCTTYRNIIKSAEIKKRFTALWEAANVIADMSIRNIATVGGNICSAISSGDAIPSMVASEALFVVAGKDGERTLSAGEFFKGHKKTALSPKEILKEFRIPLAKGRTASAFEKIARNSVDLANANVAAVLRCSDSGTIEEIKVAFGAVAPTVVRASAAEKVLVGRKPDESSLSEFCKKIPEAISPITNIRSTKEYRTEVLNALSKKAILRAYNSAMV